MKTLRYLLLTALSAAMLLPSCTDNDHFVVNGKLNGVDSGMVYLVHEDGDLSSYCDSAKITANGTFKLKGLRPSCPDFYSVRIDSSSLWLAVDSTETIEVKSDKDFKNCTVMGSEQSVQMLQWQQYVRQMEDSMAHSLMAGNKAAAEQTMFGLLKSYKDTVNRFVQVHPASLVSYYLLYKRVGFLQPFEPFAKEDRHAFAVVANTWNKRYPQSPRAIQLKELMADVARLNNAEKFRKETANTPVAGFIDLSLPNAKGDMVKLSSLKGKHILLEFCYLAAMDADVIAALKAVYEKYKAKGFEIYMVNFDKNKNSWKERTASCPWVTVLDETEISARTYNFQTVPTNYFIGKDGNINGRDVSLEEVVAYMEMAK